MITLAESGLTEGQYTLLREAVEGHTFRITAHRSNLSFSSWLSTGNPGDNEGFDFDACVFGSQIAQMHQDYITLFDPDTAGITAYNFPYTRSFGVRPSLMVSEDGETLYIFYITPEGVAYSTSSTGLLWSAPVLIVSDTNVIHISAVSDSRVHYVVKNADKDLYQFRCVDYDIAWVVSESDIYWMYPIDSFDASKDPDGNDVLVITAMIPGDTTLEYVNTSTSRVYEPSSAIMSFKYKYGTWSDHFEVEKLDTVNGNKFRRSARLQLINDTLFLTVFAVNGRFGHAYGTTRIYSSVDGKYWSVGRVMPLPANSGTYGTRLVQVGDHLFAVQQQLVYKSWATRQVNYSPEALSIDLTEHIISCSLNQDVAVQISIELANDDNRFDGHPIISTENVIEIDVWVGYQESAFSAATIKIATLEIDYIDFDRNLPEQRVKMSGRDRIAWLNDRTQSEESHFWQGQRFGGDEYVNNTSTAYGGMRHTATQSGSWETVDGELKIKTSDEEAIAFHAFSAYIWNGNTSVGFRLSKLDNEEYAGVTFRGVDHENFWSLLYYQESDTCFLVRRLNNVQENIIETAPMGWGADINSEYYLRVDFRYATVKAFSSTDGVTWNLMFTYLCDGTGMYGRPNPFPLDSGYVGLIGKGFSDSSWTPTPGDDDPGDGGTWDPVDPNDPWDPGDDETDQPPVPAEPGDDSAEVPGFTTRRANAALVVTDNGALGVTDRLSAIRPVWFDASCPPGRVIAACFDKETPYFTVGISKPCGVLIAVLTEANRIEIYSTPDIFEDVPYWTVLHDFAFTDTFNEARIFKDGDNISLVYKYNDTEIYQRYSEDAGDAWSSYGMGGYNEHPDIRLPFLYDMENGKDAGSRAIAPRNDVGRNVATYGDIGGAINITGSIANYKWQSKHLVPVVIGSNNVFAMLSEYEGGEEYDDPFDIPGASVTQNSISETFSFPPGEELTSETLIIMPDGGIALSKARFNLTHLVTSTLVPDPPSYSVKGAGLDIEYSIVVTDSNGDEIIASDTVTTALLDISRSSAINFGATNYTVYDSWEKEIEISLIGMANITQISLIVYIPEQLSYDYGVYASGVNMVGHTTVRKPFTGEEDYGLEGLPRLYRLGSPNGVGSASWTNITPALLGIDHPLAAGMDANGNTLAYVGQNSNGNRVLFLSKNAGDTWKHYSSLNVGDEVQGVKLDSENNIYLYGEETVQWIDLSVRRNKLGNLSSVLGELHINHMEVG